MKIHLDIRDNIPPSIALKCVCDVVTEGRISNNGKSYCYASFFPTSVGQICVLTRPYRKSDCFMVYKEQNK